MFDEAKEFNGDVSDCDVSSVIDMEVSFHCWFMYYDNNSIFFKYLQFMFNIVFLLSILTFLFFNFIIFRACFMTHLNLMATNMEVSYL